MSTRRQIQLGYSLLLVVPAAGSALTSSGSWLLTAAMVFVVTPVFFPDIEEHLPTPITLHWRLISWVALSLGCIHEGLTVPGRGDAMVACFSLIQILAVWIWRLRRCERATNQIESQKGAP